MARGDKYQLSTVILMLLTMYFTVLSEGCVLWKLASKPVVFGTNVKLYCKFCNNVPCCNAFTRKWTKGTNYDLIVMNSVSLNSAKYEEYLNISTKTSILTIKNFTEEDVNIPYECTYGFDTDSKVLTLNSTDFEYHPTEEIPVKLHIERNQKATANIIFNKVYPNPICFATDDGSDISYSLSVATERIGIFYKSSLQFQYQMKDNCYQNISIQCTVGTTNFTVVNSTLPCEKSSQQTKILIAIIIPTSLMIITVLLIICYCQRLKYMRCNCKSSVPNDNIEGHKMSLAYSCKWL
ncbi:uncharacterized protein LOC143059746 isoform X2 [Mytilus galloprovincialis]|uniref:uncharacterized protein LOC143059746 isoform X2 n=1 Tax=Mytilus galloprovincialis TaxID=29158 RepID=UPI003F7C4C70